MSNRTVRELGGEIATEIWKNQWQSPSKLANIPSDKVDLIVDIVMQVLARHEGCRIAQDEGLAVAPKDSGDRS